MTHVNALIAIRTSMLIGVCAVIGGGCCSKSSGGGGSTYYSGSGTTASPAEQTPPPEAKPVQQTAESGSEVVIPLYQENVVVGKREVDAGTVHLRKTVHTETVNQPVELRRETITIEREPAGTTSETTAAAANQAFQDQDFTIQLKREEPVVETRVVQSGRIVAQKQAQQETTSVQRQVRREDIAVDKGTAQDVRVSEGVSTGAASSPGGTGSASSSSDGAITDFNTLSQATDPSSISGRQVRLSSVKVKEIVDPQCIAVIGEGAQTPIYAHLQQPLGDVKAGDKVNLTGVVQEPSKAGAVTATMSSKASQAVSSQPFFLEAKSAEPSKE